MSCPNQPDSLRPLTGQVLFLGASVVSFNTNMGWGNGSSLTVELIEDKQPVTCLTTPAWSTDGSAPSHAPNNPIPNGNPITQFPSSSITADDHYHTCQGAACYINRYTGAQATSIDDRDAIVPGKVYYKYDISKGKFVSKYWIDEDPGFFATGTKIAYNGVYTPGTGLPYVYDIIGTPVVFKMDNFEFGGIVSSWEKNVSATGPTTYTVTIDSYDKILDQSYVIVDKFAGSLYSSTGQTEYGAPSNHLDTINGVYNQGDLKYGALHNVFNAYGFLESLGIDNFGQAYKNDEGVPAQYILSALRVLTSTVAKDGTDTGKALETTGRLNKRRFSSFGRLLSKTMKDSTTAAPITPSFATYSFGVLPPIAYSATNSSVRNRNVFCLDLDDIPILPNYFRITGNNGIISILDFIRQVTDLLGCDYFTTFISTSYSNQPHNVIKIRTINRTVDPPLDQLKSVVTAITGAGMGLSVTQTNYGKENNKNSSRVLYIGGNQQRLFQAKNYRLSFTQNNYVYQPALKKFVNFRKFNGGAGKGLFKEPLFTSTRNPSISSSVNPNWQMVAGSAEEKIADKIRGATRDATNIIWDDLGAAQSYGNYLAPVKNMSPDVANTSVRFIPLFEDNICPFFGYKNEENIVITNKDSNIFRAIRPVWLDSWTGQIAVYFDLDELPPLSLGGGISLYDPSVFGSGVPTSAINPGNGLSRGTPASQKEASSPSGVTPSSPWTSTSTTPVDTRSGQPFGFVVTETEFRAAMAGVDEYLTYCLGKSRGTKPDLFTMLVNIYKAKGIFLENKKSGQTLLDNSIGNGLNRQGIRPPTTVGSAKQPTGAIAPGKTKLDMNWDLYLNPDFIKDFQILTAFVGSIGSKYYGRQYLVKIPNVSAYRDTEFQLPFNLNNTRAYAYKGNGKIFYNYELTDSAWEEPGNFIDDTIMVGSDKYYTLCDERGMLPTIIGYNSTDDIDYVRLKWCQQTAQKKLQELGMNMPIGNTPEDRMKRAQIAAARAQAHAASITECGDLTNFLKPSLNLSTIQEYVEITGLAYRGNAWDEALPTVPTEFNTVKSKKLYKKGNTLELAFLDPYTFGGARAVVSTEPIFLHGTSYAYDKDPNRTIISNIALEDMIIFLKHKASATTSKPALSLPEEQYFRYLMSHITPIVDADKLVKTNSSNQSQNFAMLSPKVAHPFFVGVPVKSNIYTYGPWTNYPHFDATNIFSGRVADKIAENLIEDIKVEKNDDWVPWNYGGMSYLDEVIVSLMSDAIDYQSVLEMGSATIQGPPLFEPGGFFAPFTAPIPSGKRSATLHTNNHNQNIGFALNNNIYTPLIDTIPFADYKNVQQGWNLAGNYVYENIATTTTQLDYNVIRVSALGANKFFGPVINNISVSANANGINTTYSFRTFSRKTGAWNKLNQDRIKKQNLERIKNNKSLNDSINSSLIKAQQDVQSILDNSVKRSGPVGIASYESKLFGSSPTELLIGQARPSMKSYHFTNVNSYLANTGLRLGTNDPARTKQISTLANTTWPYGMDPGDTSTQFATWNANSGLLTTMRYDSWVGMYMADEVGAELVKEYNTKAAMSLDGIFSPISFYPTEYNSTFSLSSYLNIGNVVCPRCKGSGSILEEYVDQKNLASSLQSFACPCCSKGKAVIASGISDANINLYSLNPIVVPYDEFRNPNSQSGISVDRCRHSIAVVGRGEYNQVGDQSFHIPSNLNKYVDLGGSAVNPNGVGVNADYYKYDIFRKKVEGDTYDTPLNYRFFGFRGPMILHGWGYDTDGKPIPNEADEPKEYDSYGRPKRFIRNSTDGSNDLSKDGAFLPSDGNKLGDIIGKGWKKTGGKWEKERTDKFYLNWAERPDLWPVGPIDLRWDDERKVWTGGGCGEINPPYIIASGSDPNIFGNFIKTTKSSKKKCPYKMVYVVLEENLIKIEGSDSTYPARAFLDDLEYNTQVLPQNTRRLIYVKDRCGYSAPKGAKLLCKYSSDTGYYEPVTKQQYIVFGNIIGGNSASVDLTYIQGIKRAENIPRINIIFDNTRFNFSLSGKRRGMFMFENGAWILIGAN